MQLKWKNKKQMDETLHAFSDQIILTAKLIIMSAIRSAPHAPAFLHVYVNSGHNKVEVKPFSRLLGRQLFLQTLTKLIKQQIKCKFIRWKMLHNALRKCSRKKAIFSPSRFDPLKLLFLFSWKKNRMWPVVQTNLTLWGSSVCRNTQDQMAICRNNKVSSF